MIEVSDEYNSIEAPSVGVFKDQKSRFIALAYPVESEEQVKSLLEKARRDYHDARHHCVAYRIGYDGAQWRAGDDGEPSGTAGRPILGQIDSAGLSDVAVIVVRYFGGIKLGVPGLIAAYRAAAAEALSNAKIIRKVAGKTFRLTFSYDAMPEVMKVVKDMGLDYGEMDFAEACTMKVRVRLSSGQEFFDKTKYILNFKYEII